MALWKALDDDRREKLFAFMRALDEEAGRYFARGRETPGTLAVGAGMFDDVMEGAVRMELVRALRTAPDLEAARTSAAAAVRVWVQKHNEKRPKDVAWQRWSEHGQDTLEYLVRRVQREVLS